MTEKQLDSLDEMAEYYRVRTEKLAALLVGNKKEPVVDVNRGPVGRIRERLNFWTGLGYEEAEEALRRLV